MRKAIDPSLVALVPLSADRARLFTVFLSFVVLIFLSGCAARPGIESLVPTPVSHPDARQVTLFVATNREPAGPNEIGYGDGRGELRYEQVVISIPPGHKPGHIEWKADKARDPATSFVVVSRARLDEAEFARRVAGRMGKEGGMAGIFVHGFNQSFEKALFRAAQLAADVEGVTAPILFSWPSEGKVTGYVADRDAVTYARDDLVHLLSMLARIPAKRQIALVGHSMGTWLIMESLRQLKLLGQDRVLARYEVAIAAPDIDMDVFQKQVAAIGPLNPPLTVLVSADDRALAVSARVAGGKQRVGSIDVKDPDLEQIAERERLRIVDIGAIRPDDGARHDRFVQYIALEGNRLTAADLARNPVRQAGAFIFNTAGTVLASPFTLAGRAIAGE